MKKKKWMPIAAVILLAVLFVPIPAGPYKDGGTREYTALTYKIVNWNRISGDSVYDKTKVYLFPENFKSIDNLWYMENDKAESSFIATVIEINGSSVLAEPAEGEEELRISDEISFSIKELDDIGAEVGSVVQITYTGSVMESYPAQINATNWKLVR